MRSGSTTLGIVHPGEMGAALGAVASAAGTRVCWASAGRSAATRERAEAAGLADVGDLAALAGEADVLMSVCPPAAALDVAAEVAATGFAGTYVDANAVAPDTSEQVGAIVGERAAFVDGAVVGPPPAREGTTRLYLSGAEAGRVAALFDGTPLAAVVLDGPPGAASALKSCYATYTKGTGALLIATLALARRHGVEQALLAEWAHPMPGLLDQAETVPGRAAPKAWRFVGEMEEHADAFRAAGLPGGVAEAAAEVYRRLAGYKDADPLPTLDEVLAAVAHESADRGATA